MKIDGRKKPKEDKRRNDAVCALRNEGKTLAEIGKIFNVSRERIRQIIAFRIDKGQSVRNKANKNCSTCGIKTGGQSQFCENCKKQRKNKYGYKTCECGQPMTKAAKHCQKCYSKHIDRKQRSRLGIYAQNIRWSKEPLGGVEQKVLKAVKNNPTVHHTDIIHHSPHSVYMAFSRLVKKGYLTDLHKLTEKGKTYLSERGL